MGAVLHRSSAQSHLFKDIVVIRSIMKCVALALIAFTAVASAEPGYGYGHHLGYGYGHHLGYGYGHGYGYGLHGHYLGKRSADAEPAADAEPTAAAEPGYAYGAYGLGHAYGYGHLGYGYGHPYG